MRTPISPVNSAGKSARFVNITISTEQLLLLVPTLIENNIDFRATYLGNAYSANTAVENSYKKTTQDKIETDLESTFEGLSNATKVEVAVAKIYDKFIANNFDKPLPSIREITSSLGMGLVTFKTVFEYCYGKSFYQVYMDKRMGKAAELLKQGYTGKEVSKMVGYGEKSGIKFNKMFQKHFGMTPKKYQLTNDVYRNKRAKQRYAVES